MVNHQERTMKKNRYTGVPVPMLGLEVMLLLLRQFMGVSPAAKIESLATIPHLHYTIFIINRS